MYLDLLSSRFLLLSHQSNHFNLLPLIIIILHWFYFIDNFFTLLNFVHRVFLIIYKALSFWLVSFVIIHCLFEFVMMFEITFHCVSIFLLNLILLWLERFLRSGYVGSGAFG